MRHQIIEFVIVLLLFGLDYYIYYVISLLKHMYPTFLQLHQNKNLKSFLYLKDINFLSKDQISYNTFNFNDYHEYMKELQSKYREYIIHDINEILNS